MLPNMDKSHADSPRGAQINSPKRERPSFKVKLKRGTALP
jgi:hypothetical protein